MRSSGSSASASPSLETPSDEGMISRQHHRHAVSADYGTDAVLFGRMGGEGGGGRGGGSSRHHSSSHSASLSALPALPALIHQAGDEEIDPASVADDRRHVSPYGGGLSLSKRTSYFALPPQSHPADTYQAQPNPPDNHSLSPSFPYDREPSFASSPTMDPSLAGLSLTFQQQQHQHHHHHHNQQQQGLTQSRSSYDENQPSLQQQDDLPDYYNTVRSTSSSLPSASSISSFPSSFDSNGSPYPTRLGLPHHLTPLSPTTIPSSYGEMNQWDYNADGPSSTASSGDGTTVGLICDDPPLSPSAYSVRSHFELAEIVGLDLSAPLSSVSPDLQQQQQQLPLQHVSASSSSAYQQQVAAFYGLPSSAPTTTSSILHHLASASDWGVLPLQQPQPQQQDTPITTTAQANHVGVERTSPTVSRQRRASSLGPYPSFTLSSMSPPTPQQQQATEGAGAGDDDASANDVGLDTSPPLPPFSTTAGSPPFYAKADLTTTSAAGPLTNTTEGGALAPPVGATFIAAGPPVKEPKMRSKGPPGVKPFRCSTCPQSFNRSHDLKRHTKIHGVDRPFQCSSCDKSFTRKDALRRHLQVKKACGKSGKVSDKQQQQAAEFEEQSALITSGSGPLGEEYLDDGDGEEEGGEDEYGGDDLHHLPAQSSPVLDGYPEWGPMPTLG